MAFLGGLPTKVVADLWPGDMIFTQRLDSRLSWAMMYFTSSPIDHVAIYAGDGKIAHVTLSGFKMHSIHVFGKNTRVLPVRLAPPREPLADKPDLDKIITKWTARELPERHPLPAKLQLVLIGLGIAFGVHAERFRWKFQADIAIMAVALDLLTHSFTRMPIFSVLACLAACLTLVNLARARRRDKTNMQHERFSHPDIAYRFFFNWGGLMFTTIGPLVVSALGLMPLKLFRALGRKCAEDGTDDELEPIGQDIDNFLERWNVPYALYNPEDHERDENNDEQVEKNPNGSRQPGK